MELKVELCCCSTILTSLLFHVCLFLVVPIVVPMTSLARARSLSGDYGWGGGSGEAALVRKRCSVSPVRGLTR